jgi:hypothetical protein
MLPSTATRLIPRANSRSKAPVLSQLQQGGKT